MRFTGARVRKDLSILPGFLMASSRPALSELCHTYRNVKVAALRGARRGGRNKDGDSVIGFNIKLRILTKCSLFPPQIIKNHNVQ